MSLPTNGLKRSYKESSKNVEKDNETFKSMTNSIEIEIEDELSEGETWNSETRRD